MSKKPSVIYVSAEVSPFAKSGELADVACALPKYLSSVGIETSVFMPLYRTPEIESLSKELVYSKLAIPLGDKKVKAQIFKSEQGKYDIYFIGNPRYFWRENIYGTGKGEYLDNDERFIFFNRAVLEFILKSKMKADILHCNNWPTALIPVFLKTHYSNKTLFKETVTVFTLHNVAFQGEFPPESLSLTDLSWDFFNSNQFALNGKFNFLKTGALYSDVLNTVSVSYMRNILTAKNGFGMDQILKKRKEDLYSILNGVDYETWNPETDPFIAANFSSNDIKAKTKCKRDLIQEFGLPQNMKTPIIGIVSHLTAHKGFGILFEAIEELMKMDLRLVILGKGEESLENQLQSLERRFPAKIAVKLDTNLMLAHKIAAGADIMMIPSLYEPCGLNQLYSFKYGTVPIVRATGGLEETVIPFDAKTQKGNGFVFKRFSSQALLNAVRRALSCYEQPPVWQKIVADGMNQNFSWKKAAKQYKQLYQKALEKRKGG
jgi:starch synthase